MKKSIKILGLILLSSILLLTGCSKEEETVVKEEINDQVIGIVEDEFEDAVEEAIDKAADSAASQATQLFNCKYEIYEGEKLRASDVKTLISTVKSSNEMYSEHQITLKGVTSINQVSKNSTYTVECKKGSDGYINKVIITEE